MIDSFTSATERHIEVGFYSLFSWMTISIVTQSPGWRRPRDVYCFGARTAVTGGGGEFTARGTSFHGGWREGVCAEARFEERLALYNTLLVACTVFFGRFGGTLIENSHKGVVNPVGKETQNRNKFNAFLLSPTLSRHHPSPFLSTTLVCLLHRIPLPPNASLISRFSHLRVRLSPRTESDTHSI